MRLSFGADDLLRCRFAVSPLCETHEAVRMLRRTSRHGYHRPWLRRMRAAVAGLDLSELWQFITDGGYIPDFLGPPPEGPSVSFEEELARMRATDPELARVEMVRSLGETGSRMLDDPAWAVRRLADLTERVWTALIAPDWPRLSALLEADIAYRSRKLAEGGLERALADLHASVRWSEGALMLRNSRGPNRDLLGRGVLMMPSVFVWPDVVSGFAPPWQPALIYPARGMAGLWSAAQPRPALVGLLGANRAAILGALDGPASTTALAHRHGLALSTVSAHLSVLREAGLLDSRRQGYQVLYERTPLGESLVRRDSRG